MDACTSALPLGNASETPVIKAAIGQLEEESKSTPPGSGWWDFGLDEQATTSLCTNTTESSGAITYKWAEYGDPKSPLPYPDIVDNTEGIGAFESIYSIFPENALVLDIGGGKFDTNAKWVVAKRPDVTMLVADPFNRTKDHNLAVQQQVERAGGADVVTSVSVLNVVPDVKNRIRHIRLVHQTLKSGGLAIFKTWAGLWPMRGTRLQQVETKDSKTGEPIVGGGWCQNNAWATAYVNHVAAVFGDAYVFADNNQNALFAHKSMAEACVSVRAMAADSSEQKQKLVLDQFRKFDTNGDGFISRSELLFVFRTLAGTFAPTDKTIDNAVVDVLRAADINTDGQISYEEFVAWMYSKDPPDELAKEMKSAVMPSGQPLAGQDPCKEGCQMTKENKADKAEEQIVWVKGATVKYYDRSGDRLFKTNGFIGTLSETPADGVQHIKVRFDFRDWDVLVDRLDLELANSGDVEQAKLSPESAELDAMRRHLLNEESKLNDEGAERVINYLEKAAWSNVVSFGGCTYRAWFDQFEQVGWGRYGCMKFYRNERELISRGVVKINIASEPLNETKLQKLRNALLAKPLP